MTAGNPHDSPAGDYEQTYLIGKLRLREAKMLAQGHPLGSGRFEPGRCVLGA